MTNILKKKLKQNAHQLRQVHTSAIRRSRRAASRRRFEVLISIKNLNQKIELLLKKIRVFIKYLKKKQHAGMLGESHKAYKHMIDYIAGFLKKALLSILIVIQLSLLLTPISFASTGGDDVAKIALAVTATGLTLTIGVVAGISYLMGGQSIPELIQLLKKSAGELTEKGLGQFDALSKDTFRQLYELKSSTMADFREEKKQAVADLQQVREDALKHGESILVNQSDRVFSALDTRVANLKDAINPVNKVKAAGEKTAAFVQKLCQKALSAGQPIEHSNDRASMKNALHKHLQNLAQQQDADGIEGILETIPEGERALLAQYVCLSQPNSSEGAASEARLLEQLGADKTISAEGSTAYDSISGGSDAPSQTGAASSISEPLISLVETTVDLLFTLGFTGLYCVLMYRIFQWELFWLRFLVWEPHISIYFYGLRNQ